MPKKTKKTKRDKITRKRRTKFQRWQNSRQNLPKQTSDLTSIYKESLKVRDSTIKTIKDELKELEFFAKSSPKSDEDLIAKIEIIVESAKNRLKLLQEQNETIERNSEFLSDRIQDARETRILLENQHREKLPMNWLSASQLLTTPYQKVVKARRSKKFTINKIATPN